MVKFGPGGSTGPPFANRRKGRDRWVSQRDRQMVPPSAGTSPHLLGLAEAAGLGHQGDGRGAGRPSLLSEQGPEGPAPPRVCFRRGFLEAHPRLDSHRRPEAHLPALCMERKGLEVLSGPRYSLPPDLWPPDP